MGDTARDLDAALAMLVASARAAWPSIALDESVLLEHIASVVRAADPNGDDVVRVVNALHPDVVLCLAGLRHDRAAIAAIEQMVHASAGRARIAEAPADDLIPAVREELFIADSAAGRQPKLARYGGKGPLQRWLDVLVTRAALTMQRRARRGGVRRVGDDQLVDVAASSASSPELELLRERYGEAFRSALREVLASLSPEDRNMLRFHFVDGFGIDRLAPLLGVHRATAARRLARTKEIVLEGTRDLLRERLGIDDSEFTSLVGALLSRAEAAASFLKAD